MQKQSGILKAYALFSIPGGLGAAICGGDALALILFERLCDSDCVDEFLFSWHTKPAPKVRLFGHI